MSDARCFISCLHQFFFLKKGAHKSEGIAPQEEQWVTAPGVCKKKKRALSWHLGLHLLPSAIAAGRARWRIAAALMGNAAGG